MKYAGFALIFLGMSGCATLSKDGEKVHLEVVQKSSISIESAKTKLAGMNCRFIKNIEASIAPGSTDETYRLIVGLKNKVAKEGGNAVISSLEANFGMPIYTKGMVYSCPELASNDGV